MQLINLGDIYFDTLFGWRACFDALFCRGRAPPTIHPWSPWACISQRGGWTQSGYNIGLAVVAQNWIVPWLLETGTDGTTNYDICYDSVPRFSTCGCIEFCWQSMDDDSIAWPNVYRCAWEKIRCIQIFLWRIKMIEVETNLITEQRYIRLLKITIF